jgi:hypothetical protein
MKNPHLFSNKLTGEHFFGQMNDGMEPVIDYRSLKVDENNCLE